MRDICTWKDCNNDSKKKQLDRDKKVWANLCRMHHKYLEQSTTSTNVREVLKAWVLAQGGPKKATSRIIK